VPKVSRQMDYTTAPIDVDLPLIVFTGVGLRIKSLEALSANLLSLFHIANLTCGDIRTKNTTTYKKSRLIIHVETYV